ncbi:endoplasmic reticulum metallopeptidase 1 [Calliphora vicina]|uniref:endoplasmic reticulum metallopeptidase 1 n=1 Tax=Calliphora vicina TaxID=7373 RepID=UPI00325AE708
MTTKTFELNPDPGQIKKHKKFPWYCSPIYCVVWFLLFYVAAIPSFYYYPATILMRDESRHPDEFVGERAQIQLLGLSSIGVKLTGTVENEVHAIQFLLNEIEKIKAAARHDLYDIEVDVQYSSGSFMLWGMATSYHNVSNVIVKISSKNTNSDSYLLVNSHFDSEVGSPAAADAGVMIVVMLETLRVISISEKELKNPVVFLLNGAEESNLLASHGFITQHKWAPYCKALINLDSSGGGGREILFQTGPNHPWLIKYYQKAAKHPYATTIAEELFQNNFIPSDTDFRIFRDYGEVPGLDMAHAYNGYIYHTKYDNFQNLQRGTYQTTGDNVLALTWALANAEELTNPEAHADGHAVYYDFLGWFLVSYTETTGIIINSIVCCCAVIFIGISLYLIAKVTEKEGGDSKSVYIKCLFIFAVQVVTVLAAVGLTLLIAVIMDALGLTQCWYSEEWLIFGLYFCPMFFAMTMMPALYIQWTKKTNPLGVNDTITCFMHAHCILLVIICIIMTAMGIRSSFFPMIAVFFYAGSVLLNMILSRFTTKCYYIALHLVCQVMPFWFYTYLAFVFLNTFIPMQGRDGPENKPEILISLFAAIFVIHFGGFILPILHKFHKSKSLFSIFGILTIIFIIIAATPAGFPYKKDVAPQRFYVLHTERVIRDYDGRVVKNDTGFYIQPVDTRPNSLADTTFQNALPSSWTKTECEEETFCGLPLYNSRWMDWKNSTMWIPAQRPNLVIPTELTLTGKVYKTNTTIRYNFSLKSADRIVIYIDPLANVNVRNWSFDPIPLQTNYKPPYFIYHVYSMVDTPLEFWIEIEHDTLLVEGPYLHLGIGAHFQYHTHTYTAEFQDFLKTFPDWSYATNWAASYESWQF